MKWLFWLSVAAVVYGSLFPLIYQPVADFGAEFGAMLTQWGTRHTSDILANIALFVPYGLFGRLAGYRLRWLIPAGFLLSFALQVGQIVVFARDPAIGDVLWNIVGLLLGGAVASLPMVRHALEGVDVSPWLSPPALIILSWLLVFAVPFVPAISPSEIWYSIKPLWEVRGWRVEPLLTSTAVWLAIGLLLQDVLRKRRIAVGVVLMALLGLSFLLPVIVAENALERGYVLGGIAGAGVWMMLSYGLRLPAVWLSGLAVGLLVTVLVYRGLTPLEARAVSGRFLWLPFAGALIGPLLQNIRAMLIKLAIYGAMLWLTRGQGRFSLLVWTSLVMLVGAIEVAQLYLWSGVPESTDPLLVLLIALAIALWERRRRQRAAEKKEGTGH